MGDNREWTFIVDEEKLGRLLAVDLNVTLEKLKIMVSEDYEMKRNNENVGLSFLPGNIMSGSPLVVLSNDRQVQNFVTYVTNNAAIQLCVTFTNQMRKKPPNSSTGKDGASSIPGDGYNNGSMSGNNEEGIKKMVRFSLVDVLKKDQHFQSKALLKSTMEMCAMKYNFDYKVIKSDTRFWYIRCAETLCKWSVRAECLEGSPYFVINKYIAEHTCSPSSKTKISRTASAKTIGNMIMHKFDGANEGPKPNDVIQLMREHGCEISYSLAWDAREYAINVVRGIPEKSYGKIPNYLHMLKAANPGTHTHYETDSKGRFKYLFIAFGQSVRGFYKAVRRVIVVDGTFLKNKYKGVLLVATALDGNSNLYPIAFGVVDSENDCAWEWFFRQLKAVIVDEHGLAFVSDRHGSIGKTLETVYPRAAHGICIHHLLNNVVTNCKGKGVAGLVAKASKAYRVSDFQKKFTTICSISPKIGKYLIDADVRKWARCQFPGFRYDIRTTNPAESINSALRTPREYPVIPLLDSIREMLTRWFYERRTLSTNHVHPLTADVERKIDRRIEKGKSFLVFPITHTRFQVRGDEFDCIVDLEKRSCTCGKYDLLKIPCRHAIKAGFTVGKEPYTLTDAMYTTSSWRSAYKESINPIAVPEDSWRVPLDVEHFLILPPESRRTAGRRRKRRYESVEDKIRLSQGSQASKRHKCSRCGIDGHNRATCDRPI